MFKLRNIYLYLVCFVTLMMILFGIIFTVQNTTDLIFPTNNYYYPPEKIGGNLTEEDKKRYDEMEKTNKANQENQNKKNVVKSIAVVLVALPTFAYHWKKIEKEKKET